MKFNPLNPTSKDKSIRRKMLKNIDHKGSAQKALTKKKGLHPVVKALRTYGDEGNSNTFESRIDRFSKWRNNK